MKKLTLFFSLVLSAFILQAQYVGIDNPVINSDNVYNIGDTSLFINVFGADNFNPGDSGTYVIWDFSDKVEMPDSTEHYDYIDTTGTFANRYTVGQADLTEMMNNLTSSYFYYDLGANGDEWNRAGFYAFDSANDIYFGATYGDSTSPATLKLLQYPLQKGQNFTSTYTGFGKWGMPSSGVNDEKFLLTDGIYTLEADAFGTLILPDTTYKEAVRIHVLESFTMEMWLYGSPAITQDLTDDFYYWYVPGTDGFVMKYGVSTTSGKETNYYLSWQNEDAKQISPDFTVNVADTNVTTADSVTFVNLTSPMKNSTFAWSVSPETYEFAGGTGSADKNPIIRFTEPGDYTITLTATNSDYNPSEATITKEMYIHVSKAPEIVADFHADQTIINTNAQVHLTNDTYIDPEGSTAGTDYTWYIIPPIGWAWSGSDQNTESPDVYFTDAGCYTIKLIAHNANYLNEADTAIKENYINVGGGCGDTYTATFTVTDLSTGDPIQGATVTVSGQVGSTDAAGEAVLNLYNGDYTYTVSKSGYADTTGSITIADADIDVSVSLRSTASVNFAENYKIKIFPNPSNGLFNINSELPTNIKIYDINGKLVYEQSNITNSVIDLTKQAKGFYIIETLTNGNIEHHRIFIR